MSQVEEARCLLFIKSINQKNVNNAKSSIFDGEPQSAITTMYVENNKTSQREQIIQHENVALEPYSALPPPRSPLNWPGVEGNLEAEGLKGGN